MQKEPLVISNKSCKTYYLIDKTKVYFSGDFDSGNLQRVEKLSSYTYRITPGFDKTRQSTRKTFFHFKTHGFKNCTVKFIITRAYLLKQFIDQREENEVYHPVARRHQHGPFQKIKQDVKIYQNTSNEPELSFSFNFQQQNWVQFAFTYPYSYQDNETLINTLIKKFKKHRNIYFHHEILCRTSETRKVDLITITDQSNISHERQAKVQGIFEEGERPFKIDKPRIIISARVHPGQTPSSFCMEGILKFLLNEIDSRSDLLRKNFQFVLIPMLNPEGVFEGMFRNDLHGQNLNRMYLYCDAKKHKSIWSVKKYLESINRVDFFFDLHAHPSRKGFFIYGNALQEFFQQIQAQIFSKMIQYNCPYFENLDCIYSQKAMVAKDKHDNFTKQGCGRVFYYKMFKMIHSFTVQCGYFAPTKLNPYPPQRQFTIPSSQYECTNDWQSFSTKQYTPQSYMMLGKSILISILDLFHINPFTRISTSDFKSINNLRKFTAQRVYNQVQRFRLIDSNCYRKIRDIAQLIEQNYYVPRFKNYGLTISQNYGMKHRKKSSNIRPRIPLNKSLSRQRQIKDNPKTARNQTQQKVTMPIKSMSQRQFPINFLQPFERYPKNSISVQKRLRLMKAQKQKIIQIDQVHTSQSVPIKRKDHSFSKFLNYEKYQQPAKFKKMEEQVIAEILNSKLKHEQKRMNEHFSKLLKIDKLGSFLKKQSKTIKLPLIKPQKSYQYHTESN